MKSRLYQNMYGYKVGGFLIEKESPVLHSKLTSAVMEATDVMRSDRQSARPIGLIYLGVTKAQEQKQAWEKNE